MGWEIGPVAPVLARPEEEHLDTALASVHMYRDDIRFAYAGHVDALMGLDVGQGSQAVAVVGGSLEC